MIQDEYKFGKKTACIWLGDCSGTTVIHVHLKDSIPLGVITETQHHTYPWWPTSADFQNAEHAATIEQAVELLVKWAANINKMIEKMVGQSVRRKEQKYSGDRFRVAGMDGERVVLSNIRTKEELAVPICEFGRDWFRCFL